MAACPWLEQSIFQSSCATGGGGDATSLRGIPLGADVGMPGDGEVLTYDAGSTQWIAAPPALTPPADPADNGKIPVATAGNFTYSDTLTLVSLTLSSGPLAIGPLPAAAGAVRLPNAAVIGWRNNANSADAASLQCLSSNNSLQIAATAGITLANAVTCSSSVSINGGSGNTTNIVGGTSITMAGAANKTLSAGAGSTATAPSLTLSGWDTTGASQTGGGVTVRAGNGAGATSNGGILQLQSGEGTSTNGVITFYNGPTHVASIGPGFLSVEPSPATAGTIRMPNNTSITWRSTTSSNVAALTLDASNQVLVGNTGNVFVLNGAANSIINVAGSSLIFQVAGTTRATWSASALLFSNACSQVLFTGNLTGQTLGGANTSSTPENLIVKAAGKVTSSGNGAELLLRGGRHTSGTGGAVRLQYNPDDTSPVNRFVVDSVGIGFFNVTPVARAAAYTPTNVTTDRSFDADTVVVSELADVVGTLIADLQAYGLLQ